MKELEYLSIINKELKDSSLLGDDCAFLQDLGVYVTQDTLVEDVHFKLSTATPYQLAQKAVQVNVSDLAAAGAEPLYITISLSLPTHCDEGFVKEFYKGIEFACSPLKIKVAGGDLTAADKVVVSVCAIGKKVSSVSVSRGYANAGDVVVVTGCHGDSAGGLNLLTDGSKKSEYLIKKHLLPVAQVEKSKAIINASEVAGVDKIAMMDTSDGLGDAVYKISKASGKMIEIEHIPVSDELVSVFPKNYIDLALWGGEDYELIACIDEKVYNLLDKTKFIKIGRVLDKTLSKEFIEQFENKSFKHF